MPYRAPAPAPPRIAPPRREGAEPTERRPPSGSGQAPPRAEAGAAGISLTGRDTVGAERRDGPVDPLETEVRAVVTRVLGAGLLAQLATWLVTTWLAQRRGPVRRGFTARSRVFHEKDPAAGRVRVHPRLEELPAGVRERVTSLLAATETGEPRLQGAGNDGGRDRPSDDLPPEIRALLEEIKRR